MKTSDKIGLSCLCLLLMFMVIYGHKKAEQCAEKGATTLRLQCVKIID